MAVLPLPAPGCASCAARDAVIAEPARLLEEQAAAISEMRAGLVALAEEVRALRRKLGRTSGNSSMAPSAGDLPGRTAPALEPERDPVRRPGGQKGPKGAHLAWSPDPGRVVPHFPAGPCGCGAGLQHRPRPGPGRHPRRCPGPAGESLPPRRPARPQGSPQEPRPQAGTLPRTAPVPARP